MQANYGIGVFGLLGQNIILQYQLSIFVCNSSYGELVTGLYGMMHFFIP